MCNWRCVGSHYWEEFIEKEFEVKTIKIAKRK